MSFFDKIKIFFNEQKDHTHFVRVNNIVKNEGFVDGELSLSNTMKCHIDLIEKEDGGCLFLFSFSTSNYDWKKIQLVDVTIGKTFPNENIEGLVKGCILLIKSMSCKKLTIKDISVDDVEEIKDDSEISTINVKCSKRKISLG